MQLGPNDEAERLLFFYLESGKRSVLNTCVPMSVHDPADPSDTIVRRRSLASCLEMCLTSSLMNSFTSVFASFSVTEGRI